MKTFFDALSEWWSRPWDGGSPPLPDLPDFPGTRTQRVRVRERRSVSGKETMRREIGVEVKDGVVIITGDVAGITINGKRVRFKEPT